MTAPVAAKKPTDRLPKKTAKKAPPKRSSNGHGEVFDAGAAYQASRAEFESETFPFVLRGAAAELPHPKDWPIETTDLLASGQLQEAMRGLVGEDDWAELAKQRPVIGEIDAVFSAAAEWAGVETLGN